MRKFSGFLHAMYLLMAISSMFFIYIERVGLGWLIWGISFAIWAVMFAAEKEGNEDN